MPPEEHNTALLIIVSGPAGSGKTTVCDRMLDAFSPSLQRVVTSTTRAPRQGEQHEKDYFFFTDEEFDERVKADQFYEWAQVHSHRYGTLKSEIRDKLNRNIDLLLNIDVQGAATFRRAAEADPLPAGRLLSVFIMPGSIEQLRERLLSRSRRPGRNRTTPAKRPKRNGRRRTLRSPYNHWHTGGRFQPPAGYLHS